MKKSLIFNIKKNHIICYQSDKVICNISFKNNIIKFIFKHSTNQSFIPIIFKELAGMLYLHPSFSAMAGRTEGIKRNNTFGGVMNL